MKVTIIHEAGYEAALLGIGLSFGLTSDISAHDFIWDNADLWDRMEKRAKGLRATSGGAINEFLGLPLDATTSPLSRPNALPGASGCGGDVVAPFFQNDDKALSGRVVVAGRNHLAAPCRQT